MPGFNQQLLKQKKERKAKPPTQNQTNRREEILKQKENLTVRSTERFGVLKRLCVSVGVLSLVQCQKELSPTCVIRGGMTNGPQT